MPRAESYKASVRMRIHCPNEDAHDEQGTDYPMLVRPLSRGTKFRCTECLFAFTASGPEVRRMFVGRMVNQ